MHISNLDILLGNKDLTTQEKRERGQRLLRVIKKIIDKGGLTVITGEYDSLITTYNYDSYNRKLAYKKNHYQ